MVNGPTYGYGLVQKYVQNKVGNNITDLYVRLNQFIQENGPVIESVYRNLKILDSTIFGNISKTLMDQSIRQDLEGALKGQQAYNTICDEVWEGLFRMTENANVTAFLQENGVPDISSEQVGYFIDEVKLYWAATYGNHIVRLAKVHNLLIKIKEKLDLEINLLKRLPQEGYLEGLQTNATLRQLFYDEREIFLKIVDESKITSDEVGELEAKLKAEMTKLNFQIEAYKNATKKIGIRAYQETYVDLALAKSDLERAILSLSYLLGAFYIVIKIPGNMIIKKSSWGLGKVIHRELSETSNMLINQAITLLTGRFVPT